MTMTRNISYGVAHYVIPLRDEFAPTLTIMLLERFDFGIQKSLIFDQNKREN